MIKTERKLRGEWYKMTRETAYATIRAYTEQLKQPLTVEQADRMALAVYFLNVYYRLMVRLPDVEAYDTAFLPKVRTMIDYSEDQLRLFAPYLKLQTYEPKTWTRVDDGEPI